MEISGLPTFHARAERWECDTNDHWNTRFYLRSFQAASVMAGSLVQPPHGAGPNWHVRFHKELFAGAPFEVRSSRVPGGGTLHVLASLGRICATALEQGAPDCPALPPAVPDLLALAVPRGITGPAPAPWDEDRAHDRRTEVGFARTADLDPAGRLYFDDVLGRCAHGSAAQLCHLGFTPDYIAGNGINAMLLEQRASFLAACPPGAPLSILSRMGQTAARTFTTVHHLQTRCGTTIAVLELCLAAVDLNARRTTALPDFIAAP